MRSLLTLLTLVALLPGADALDNGLGRTPLMGFNPWNCFGIGSKGTCKLPKPWVKSGQPCHGFNETVILDVGRAFVSSGLKTLGYEYINLDCGYSTGFRGTDGSLTVNTTRYPHGMKWLGDQLHSMGLKYGMYSDAGKQQCCSRVYGPNVNDGSLGFEEEDAKQFASWGVDLLKHDGCGQEASSYPNMRTALNKTGRPIFYSVHGPKGVPLIANMWRTTGDIDNNWASILSKVYFNDQLAAKAAPGGFNDPDMLETGNLWGPLGDAEGRSHFSMWAAMKAPLLVGTDVTNMTNATLTTLSNHEVIQINQDSLGLQAVLVQHPNASSFGSPSNPAPVISFVGALSGGSYVALVVNNQDTIASDLTVPVQLLSKARAIPAGVSFTARELWQHKNFPGTYTASSVVEVGAVGAHDCAMFRFDPSNKHL
jgi:alpha-galactosidase